MSLLNASELWGRGKGERGLVKAFFFSKQPVTYKNYKLVMTTGSDKSMRDSCFRFCYLPMNYALNDVPSSDHLSQSPAFPEPQVRSYVCRY